jgi:hypothetical protein
MVLHHADGGIEHLLPVVAYQLFIGIGVACSQLCEEVVDVSVICC